jgi:hypothetical protein
MEDEANLSFNDTRAKSQTLNNQEDEESQQEDIVVEPKKKVSDKAIPE